jgi:hypothetical protein
MKHPIPRQVLSRLLMPVILMSSLGLFPITCLAGGITLFTHGFTGSGRPDWLNTMRTALNNRLPANKGRINIDLIVAENHEGDLEVTETSTGGEMEETLIVLDWSDAAFFKDADGKDKIPKKPTADVAETVVAYLLNHPPLLRLPLHMAGHSRGSSLVSEIAHQLGRHGIWVEQVTHWDPCPISIDEPVEVYSNTLFVDNYWRDGEFLIPEGSPVSGAYNRNLGDLEGGYGTLDGGDHSDVHLWYFGTLNLNTPAPYSDGLSVTQGMRNAWWTPSEQQGAKTGFYFSQTAVQDWGTTDPRLDDVPRTGLHPFFGGTGPRQTLTYAAAPYWPNVRIQSLGDGSTEFTAREEIPIKCYFQDVDGSMSVSLFRDTDTNPYNSPEPVPIHPTEAFSNLGTIYHQLITTWTPESSDEGYWYILARAADGERTRDYYWPRAITILSEPVATPTATPSPSQTPAQTATETPSPTPCCFLALAKLEGYPGESIEFQGSNYIFHSGHEVTLLWDGEVLTTTGRGSTCGDTFYSPDGPVAFQIPISATPGAHTVCGLDACICPCDGEGTYGKRCFDFIVYETTATPTSTLTPTPTETPPPSNISSWRFY